ncbi:MAG: acyl-CoA dehydrogenase family protein [Roseovarius sp.]|nr:acyl-CoA dehydrogenase family protein [Roseovarius sp.]
MLLLKSANRYSMAADHSGITSASGNAFTGVDPAFRQEVADFVSANLPGDIARKVDINAPLNKDDFIRWQKILHNKGWVAPSWPVEFGGTGWSLEQRFAFEEVCAEHSAPRLPQFGVGMLGPILIHRGTDDQRARYLPKILAADEWWCQGYSEPGAGSDLASLKTRAVREDDEYVVNGSKTWTSYAHYADRMFALVRTDNSGRKQQGITFLLLDMKAPGVTVRPIVGLNGQHVVNEVFLDNVRVPVSERIGEENEGWAVAKALLGHERTGIARVGFCKKQFQLLMRLADQSDIEGRRLLDDPAIARKLAALSTDIDVLEWTNLRTLAAVAESSGDGTEASVLKVVATETQQRITELLFEVAGPAALELARSGEAVSDKDTAYVSAFYLDWRKSSIYGGSNEIQRNIISKIVLRG